MRILVSALFLNANRLGGISHLLLNVLRGFAASGEGARRRCTLDVLVTDKGRELVPRHSTQVTSSVVSIPYGRMYRVLYDNLVLPWRLRWGRHDGMLFPLFTAPATARRPFAVIIPDLQVFACPENYDRLRRLYLTSALPATARKATRVIAISQATARDVSQHLGVNQDRLEVIYPPLDPIFYEHAADDELVLPPQVRSWTAEGRPIVLGIGTHHPHKNWSVILKALAEPVLRRAGAVFVLLGAPGAGTAELKAIRQACRVSDQSTFVGYGSDHVKIALLRRAAVLVHPSTFEGFGIPIIEALALRRPAVVSDLPVLREAGLDGVLGVREFTRPQVWAEALAEALTTHLPIQPELSAAILQRHHPTTIADRYAAAFLSM